MSGTATKTTNRQIRKAFGDQALEHIARLEAGVKEAYRLIQAESLARNNALAAEARIRRQSLDDLANKLRWEIKGTDLIFDAFRTLPWYRRLAWALGLGAGR